MKINFAKRLYNSSGIDKCPGYYKLRLEMEAGKKKFYVLLRNEYSGRMEIVGDGELRKKYYKTHTPTVIGMAESYEEAVAVVVSLLCIENGITCVEGI